MKPRIHGENICQTGWALILKEFLHIQCGNYAEKKMQKNNLDSGICNHQL